MTSTDTSTTADIQPVPGRLRETVTAMEAIEWARGNLDQAQADETVEALDELLDGMTGVPGARLGPQVPEGGVRAERRRETVTLAEMTPWVEANASDEDLVAAKAWLEWLLDSIMGVPPQARAGEVQ